MSPTRPDDKMPMLTHEVQSGGEGEAVMQAVYVDRFKYVRLIRTLRAFRALKLMRHFAETHILSVALKNAARQILVPGFAMLLMIIVLSSALWTVEGDPHDDDAFSNATDALWCVFWLVTALGFDGPMGTGGAAGQCIIAVAILSGLLLTTMPITVIGEAFANAWSHKEMMLLQTKLQHVLIKTGVAVRDFDVFFAEVDTDGSGYINWHEFKEMLHSTLMIFLSVPTHTGLTPNPYAHTPCAILPLHPQAHRRCTRSSQCMLCYLLTDGMCTSCYAMQVPKMRTLFEEIDHDRDGAVSCKEMCRKLFPNQDWELIWHERAEQLLFDERTRAAIYVQSRRSHSARIPTCIVRALFALWRVHCVCCAGATGLPWTPCPSLDQPTLAARGGGGEYDRRLERELLRVGGPARPH